MTDVNVVWLDYNGTPTSRWCTAWLEETLTTPGTGPWRDPTFYHGVQISDVPDGDGAIVIFPAEYQVEHVDRLNAELARLPWVVLILASDEQGLFPAEKLDHPNMKLWVMTPHFEKRLYPPGTQFLGEMYPPDARKHIAKFKSLSFERQHQCSFSGQITHERRYKLADWMTEHDFFINKTKGFTQGLSREHYYNLVVDTEVTAAPSGPVTPDSFRAFETLEAGGIPLLDLYCPVPQDCDVYWGNVLGWQHPLPVEDWNEHAAKVVDDVSANWPLSSNVTFSFWQMYKRELRYRILDGVPGLTHGPLTILVPTSPIPSHPSTVILDETLASVRFHHPHADILLMIDGVRPEQEHRRADYDRYVQELCWRSNFEWKNVYPIVFAGHEHQSGMTRVALDYVRTPMVMYVEHDIPLVTDMPIDWDSIFRLVMSGDVDVVKFSFEAMGIHPEHEHLALDPEIVLMHGCPVRRTTQWSQRPNVATTAYYRRVMQDWFPLSSCTMLEDLLHSRAQQFPEQFRLATYMPDGSKVRCFHIDGREGDIKYDMRFE